jgi:MFS family permease
MSTFPVLTVLVQHLYGLNGAATIAGLVFMSLGVSSAASALITGWLASRYGVRRILWLGCLGAAIVFSGPSLANSIPTLAIMMAAVGLFQGGLVGSVNTLIARTAPMARQGAVFGVVQSITALGFTVGPLFGGIAGDVLGLRSVFIINSGLYAVTTIAVFILLRERRSDS